MRDTFSVNDYALLDSRTPDWTDEQHEAFLDAVRALGGRVTRHIETMLCSRVPETRRLALRGLAEIGEASASVIRPLIGDADATVRSLALRVLPKVALAELAFLPLLADPSEDVRATALEMLPAEGGNAEMVKAVGDLLVDSAFAVRTKAGRWLAAVKDGNGAHLMLGKALDSGSVEAREAAAFGVWKEARGPEFAESLLVCAQTQPDSVRLYAAAAIMSIKRLQADVRRIRDDLLATGDEHVVVAAIKILCSAEMVNGDTLRKLGALLRNGTQGIQLAVLDRMKKIGPAGSVLGEELLQLLDSGVSAPSIEAMAIAAIGALMLRSPHAIGRVRQALVSPSALVRQVAARVAGELNCDEAVPDLLVLMADEDEWVREAAKRSMVKL